MKHTIFSLVSFIAANGLASAQSIHFHSDFDEADLASITGLNIDSPVAGIGNTNDGTGTITLNTTNESLDFTTNDSNLWTTRDGAPIAWVASPVVAMGQTWYVETQITHTDSTGPNTEWDQAGITFYSGTLGANPGNENTGIHESLFLGISDWNAWDHRLQGFADNDPNFTAAADLTDDTFEYRIEITENGASDLYNFFYREDPADAWTRIGDTDLSQDFNNDVVGLFIKSHNNNLGTSTAFDYLTIGITASTTSLVDYALANAPEIEIVGTSAHILVSKNIAASDVDLLVELSPDLLTWTQGGTLLSDIDQGDGTTLQTYLLSDSTIDAPKLFARVRVQALAP